jgi:outer membrane protein TolC
VSAVGLLCALALSAQTSPLTWSEVQRSVEASHPSLVSATADVDAATAEVLAGEGIFDPVLKLKSEGASSYYNNAMADAEVSALTPLWGTRVEGGYRVGVGDFPVYDGKKKTSDFGEARVGLSVPLLRDGSTDSRRATLEKATVEQQRRQQARTLTRLDLMRAAASSYWEWVAAGERLSIHEDLLALAETRDDQLQRRANAGDVPAFEVTDNARLIAQRRNRVIAARRALERAALALAIYTRDDDGRPIVPTRERLPPLPSTSSLVDSGLARDPASVRDAALEHRPEAVSARLSLSLLDVDRALANNQLLPELTLNAGISQDFGSTHDPLTSSSSVWSPDPKTRAVPEARVGLSLQWPTFQRAARGRQQAVSAAIGRAQAALQLIADRLSLEVDDSLQALTAAEQRAAITVTEVDAALQVSVGERQRFDAGDSTLLLVNLREVAHAEARLAAVDATVDVARAALGVQLVAGLPD